MKKQKRLSTWKIEFNPQAIKNLKKIPKKSRIKILESIRDTLIPNPFVGEILQGAFKGYYKFRVGDYRVIYTLEKDRLVIVVVRVALRSVVYRLPP